MASSIASGVSIAPIVGAPAVAPPRPRGRSETRDARSGDAVAPVAPSDEASMVERLRARDETAFVALVERHGPSLRRMARLYTSDAVADEVIQETWIAVLQGIDRFQGRSTLRTWMVRILMNIARGRAEREGRHVPFSAFAVPTADREAAVDADRFRPVGDAFPGGWISFPERWDEQPETRYLSLEGVAVAREAIAALPPAQREVVSLRDIEGWTSDEVSEALNISPGNQRVLLHRGRSKVRAALEASIRRSAMTAGSRP